MTQRERSVGLSQTGILPVAPAAIFEDGDHCAVHQGGDSARRGAEQRILPFFFCLKTLRKLVCKEREKRDGFPHSNPFSQSPGLGSTENFIPEETVNSRILDELAPNHHRARPYCGSG